jgi:hypothetical protein
MKFFMDTCGIIPHTTKKKATKSLKLISAKKKNYLRLVPSPLKKLWWKFTESSKNEANKQRKKIITAITKKLDQRQNNNATYSASG